MRAGLLRLEGGGKQSISENDINHHILVQLASLGDRLTNIEITQSKLIK